MEPTLKITKYVCPRCGKPLCRDGKTPGGKQRWLCRVQGARRAYCYKTTSPESPRALKQDGKPEGPPPVFQRKLKQVKRYLITAAQNATPLNAGLWRALQRAKAHYKAELLVIPLRYRNPTSRYESGQQETDEWWDAKVVPFLWNVRKSLNKNIAVLGDIKIQPTAVEPLTGLEGFSGSESCIIGHTKLALRMVPTPGHKFPKIMTTTGACTVKNYSDSRAGKHGEFHHTAGAVIIEISGDKFWLRHLNANADGSFTDLDKRFTPDGAYDAPSPAALVMGDTHVDFVDDAVCRATFGVDGLIHTLKPKKLVWHDLLDAYSVNPHHRGNPFNAIAKLTSGLDDVAAEVRRAIEFVIKRTPKDAESYIVSSNHDDFLHRWILSHDWKSDARNAAFYLETALAIAKETKMGAGGTEYPRPFKYWVDQRAAPRIHCLGDEELTIAGVLCSMHGDRGPGGARGSIKNLRRIGTKSFIGHSHSPGISEGCYQVGTSSRLQLEYNVGPSGWMHCHGLIHADGKRQLIFIVDGKWRL
jgi:hypothetical protein